MGRGILIRAFLHLAVRSRVVLFGGLILIAELPLQASRARVQDTTRAAPHLDRLQQQRVPQEVDQVHGGVRVRHGLCKGAAQRTHSMQPVPAPARGLQM